jgi:hypothetical protein
MIPNQDTTKVNSSGVNKLLSQYQIIGQELLGVEDTGLVSGFREGVSMIAVEVLESYLEDLLDLGISEEVLYLRRATKGAVHVLDTILFSAKKIIPQIGLVRRIKFAKIVSAEVSRRRGRDGTTRTPILSFDQLLKVPSPSRTTRFQGAARVRTIIQ